MKTADFRTKHNLPPFAVSKEYFHYRFIDLVCQGSKLLFLCLSFDRFKESVIDYNEAKM